MPNISSIDQSNPALFKIVFSKFPNIEFWSYSVNLPGVTIGEVIQPTPIYDLKLPGDKLTYDPLVLNFIVQENLANWIEIYNWLFAIGKPVDITQYRNKVRENPSLSEKQNIYSDMQLFILSTKSNPLVKVTFVDVWPAALSPLTYDSSISDVSPLTSDVTLNFSYYKLEAI